MSVLVVCGIVYCVRKKFGRYLTCCDFKKKASVRVDGKFERFFVLSGNKYNEHIYIFVNLLNQSFDQIPDSTDRVDTES